jgi:hypothetical protein
MTWRHEVLVLSALTVAARVEFTLGTAPDTMKNMEVPAVQEMFVGKPSW